VGCTGLEPVTPTLSTWCSKPTELTTQKNECSKIIAKIVNSITFTAMEWRKLFKLNSFYTSLGILMSGNAIAQGINFLFSILFARLFNLNDFGEFGIFTACIFVIGEVLNLKMDQALVLCKNECEVSSTIKFANKIGFYISIFGTFVFYVFQLKNEGALLLSLLLFLALFIFGRLQMVLTHHLWLKNFKLISVSRFLQVIFGSFITLISFKLFPNLNPLIIGFILGNLFAFLFLYFNIHKNNVSISTDSLNFNPKGSFRNFLTYGTFSSLLNVLNKNLPFFLFKNFYGLETLGSFSFSNRIIQAPLGIVTQSLGKVFFQKAAENDDKEPLLNYLLIKNTLFFSCITGFFPMLFLSIFGTWIFVFLFGEKWQEAGKMTMILAPLFFMSFISQPISMYLDVKKELKWEFFYNLSFLIARFLLLYFVGLRFSFEFSLYAYVVVGILFYFILLLKLYSISKS
jgi:lipopolysaccharide exporter